MEEYGKWLAEQNWNQLYAETDCHKKAEVFHNLLIEKFHEVFPAKSFKVCSEDKPWITRSLKNLDRKRKREFYKNHKSPKWYYLDSLFEEKCEEEKENYYQNIVHDLKTSNPSQWYSKMKRMSGQEDNQADIDTVEELNGLEEDEQVEVIADHYAAVSNLYEPVHNVDFKDYLEEHSSKKPPNIKPYKVMKVIKKMNRNSATVPGDLPMKLISLFSDDLALPLSHLINCCFQAGQYPVLWKNEIVSPVPKVFPPEKLDHLRRISGLFNFAKITDKILAEFLVEDMAPSSDQAQYGNEEGLSVQHYLVKLLHQVLTSLERNSQSEAFTVVMSMVDWSKAFDRQSHVLGVQSFIDNGVRPSLIPVLLSFFQERTMQVKLYGKLSCNRKLPGGGPQGDILGIIEHKSQFNDNTDFLDTESKFKYIDDLSVLEVLNMVLCGISSYNSKQQVPSDIGISNHYINNGNFKTQDYLTQISKWTTQKQMKLNCQKSNYMIFNFTRNFQFNTRLYLDNNLLEEVKETRLLGVILNSNMTWHSNTRDIVKRCYQRMLILRKLSQFSVPVEELVHIYCMYIRSVAEQSSVVWSSALTRGEEYDLERVQKVALRVIFKDCYLSYEWALSTTNLPTLKARRAQLSLKFALKCTKNSRVSDMFPLRDTCIETRNHEKYEVTQARTNRLAQSAIPSMQKQLNKYSMAAK